MTKKTINLFVALGVFELRMLDYKVIDGATGLTSIEARVWEQNMINYYGLDNLYNKINSIAPSQLESFGIKIKF